VSIDILNWVLDPDAAHGVHLAGPARTWTMCSYSDLATNAGRVAALLRGYVKSPGGVVSLTLSEPQDFIAALGGVWLAGYTASPVAAPAGFRGHSQYVGHLRRIIKAAEPAAVLCDVGLLDTVRAVLQEVDLPAAAIALDWTVAPPPTSCLRSTPPDIALLQFTSGSSGQPKGIAISAGNLEANLEAIHKWVSFSAEDSVASWLPLYHDMGLIGSLLTPATKACDIWLARPEQFLRDPMLWLECLGRHGTTITTAPNFGYAYAARKVQPEQIADLDFSPWRVAVIGAERVDAKAICDFSELTGPRGFRVASLAPAYGLAEATLAVCAVIPGGAGRIVRLKADSLRTGSPVRIEAESRLGIGRPSGSSWLSGCGPPVEGTRIIIRGEEGQQLPLGHLGEICVCGPGVARGYQGQHHGSTTTFTRDELRTGDAGFMLDGEVFVVGRIGDSLKVRGRLLPAALFAHDLAGVAVHEAAWLGVHEEGRSMCERPSSCWFMRLAVCVCDGFGDEADVAVVEAAEVLAQVHGDVVAAEAGGDAQDGLLGSGAGQAAGVQGVDGGLPVDGGGGLAGEDLGGGDEAAEFGQVQEVVVAGDELDGGQVGGDAGGGVGEQAQDLAAGDGSCVHGLLSLRG